MLFGYTRRDVPHGVGVVVIVRLLLPGYSRGIVTCRELIARSLLLSRGRCINHINTNVYTHTITGLRFSEPLNELRH